MAVISDYHKIKIVNKDFEIDLMMKILTLIGLIVVGCLVAGLYGVIHDQLTYTISPEYYTKFKFYQFGLLDKGNERIFRHPRVQVSLVGFLATWWMGIPIALILGLFSLHPHRKTMISTTIKAFLVTIGVAFVTAIYGFFKGYVDLSNQPKDNFSNWYIPDNLVDFKSFIIVGSIHNHSYLGGLIGLFVAIAYVLFKKRTIRLQLAKTADE